MATKLQVITEFAQQLTVDLSFRQGLWQDYLRTASRIYKYPFPEQLLIYGQKPDATACAPTEIWNRRMGRWVNRGAKGIALIDDSGPRVRLKYVFDVSDTHPGRYRSLLPRLWKMQPEYEAVVWDSLKNTFGEPEEPGSSFAEKIISISESIAMDTLPDYLNELVQVKPGSFLEELDELNIAARLRSLLANSVAYTVMARCGIDVDYYFAQEDFQEIFEFNTFDTVSVLGTATSDISKMMLLEIGRTVDRLGREQKFAKGSEIGYSATKEANGDKQESGKEAERNGREFDLHHTGGVSVSQPDPAHAGGNAAGQVRTDAPEVSEGESEGDLQPPAAVRETGGASGGDRPDSHADGGTAGQPDGGAAGRERGTETGRPDEVGGPDEHHPKRSRGSSSEERSISITQQEADSEEQTLPPLLFENAVSQQAIGNVPFGNYKVSDKQYDKLNFAIHDYFFAKTLDKVRPGGVVAFLTSSFTMDKQNPTVRKYIAQRADLLGAIRLPNDAFKANAGTEVVADILFLQKRDRTIETEPDWVHLGKTEDGFTINSYFVEHPDMILGQLTMESMQYGRDAVTCVPFPDSELSDLLDVAVSNIHGNFMEYESAELFEEEEDRSIPANPNVRNFSYTVVDSQIYYREDSRMFPVEVSVTAQGRIKGMIAIRDSVRSLIDMQTQDWPDEDIEQEQGNLNRLYDEFTKKYGLLNNRGNQSVFGTDSSYPLLCSLEFLDENGNLKRKADMLHKRTIRPAVAVTHVDTASEALAVSLAEKACVDLEYMAELMGHPGQTQEITENLRGVIFKDPMAGDDPLTGWQTADEYLSGNVREKLKVAQLAATKDERFLANVEALEKAQPQDLTAAEISVRLGATWLPVVVVQQFMYELLKTPRYAQLDIKVRFSSQTAEWNISNKSKDRGNVQANSTYGTNRINAYKIIEETLNLRDVRIFDYVLDEHGNRTPVLNKKETAIAQGKQELIKQAFQDWVWKDLGRREKLVRLYNDRFNSNRTREYDGSHLKFPGMNPEITLRPHQVNAIAHILYGGNTLLAHVVGAGKTFEMVAAAQESKRLGLCRKSLFVVPNHLTEQWASEYLQLYPSANILVAAKKDFEKQNRRKFCGRIATGDYDAIIIGHSQFEKIPMSDERQKRFVENQIADIMDGIAELKGNQGERFQIKQLEKAKKSLQRKLDSLTEATKKDDVVTFEELGVDRIFVDEAHYYKNLAAYSKMRNVGGISQVEAKKSSDLFMKCRYLDEVTGGRGVVFATGTPISNSMVELYTMQRYLQYSTLERHGLMHFDCWASTFGETVTAIELAPEGTGYRAKTRFAKFYNLPELMTMFREVADIQTADMLNLPVPKANYHNVAVKPSDVQKDMVAKLGERAEAVRNREVPSHVDNMLLITNDGRKLALDQRLTNPLLPDFEGSKVNACVENIYRFWAENKEQNLTQLVFCDLSTPTGKASEEGEAGFQNVYDDIRSKLIARGVPADEVCFIHDANTEVRKKEVFSKVRQGQVRVLLGSTQKMGAGTNVQTKLIALHDLDCPWRPSDLEQRSGRIIRQGNENEEIHIFRYVTEETFDAYLYQLVENKQKFISQIMSSKSPVRSAEDIDEAALSYAEIKMLATGNPYIKEKMDLDIAVSKLKLLKSNHLNQRYALEDQLYKTFPQDMAQLNERIKGFVSDIAHRNEFTPTDKEKFPSMVVYSTAYDEKADAGKALLEACHRMTSPESITIGEYRGFEMELSFETFSKEYRLSLKHRLSHTVALGADVFGNITRIDNALNSMEDRLLNQQEQLENLKVQIEAAKAQVEVAFPQEEELQEKSKRLDELNILLNMDHKESEIVDEEIVEEVDRDEALQSKSRRISSEPER